MRTFAGFNPAGPPCPICKTRADVETVLVPIPGTEHDRIVEARQVHKRCYDLAIEMRRAKQAKTE